MHTCMHTHTQVHSALVRVSLNGILHSKRILELVCMLFEVAVLTNILHLAYVLVFPSPSSKPLLQTPAPVPLLLRCTLSASL